MLAKHFYHYAEYGEDLSSLWEGKKKEESLNSQPCRHKLPSGSEEKASVTSSSSEKRQPDGH